MGMSEAFRVGSREVGTVRRKRRRVVAEVYRKDEKGRLHPEGAVVMEYDGPRRGGSCVTGSVHQRVSSQQVSSQESGVRT
jgi:hypothetical protein